MRSDQIQEAYDVHIHAHDVLLHAVLLQHVREMNEHDDCLSDSQQLQSNLALKAPEKIFKQVTLIAVQQNCLAIIAIVTMQTRKFYHTFRAEGKCDPPRQKTFLCLMAFSMWNAIRLISSKLDFNFELYI